MSISLLGDDFRALIRIVSTHNQFRTVQGRINLVVNALKGSPRADDIIRQLIFDGSAWDAATQIVERLSSFGRVTPDKEALAIFINTLLDYQVGEDEKTAFLRGLFDKYPLDKPVTVNPAIDEWRGQETPAYVQEKIIGENTLRDIRVLHLALEAAAAVVHITLPNGYGSGFLMGERLLMTNHHVIGTAEIAAASAFTFGYELAQDGQPRSPYIVHAQQNGLFYTNRALDYTVVELESVPDGVKPLKLKGEQVAKDSRAAIIQHPGGHYKKIAMQNNFVAYADARVVQYITSTTPGSSGSPVFNDDFAVVAIHHSGGMLEEPDTLQRYLRNGGSSMLAVLSDLQQNASDIYKRANHA